MIMSEEELSPIEEFNKKTMEECNEITNKPCYRLSIAERYLLVNRTNIFDEINFYFWDALATDLLEDLLLGNVSLTECIESVEQRLYDSNNLKGKAPRTAIYNFWCTKCKEYLQQQSKPKEVKN
jgi:hypothetical protein